MKMDRRRSRRQRRFDPAASYAGWARGRRAVLAQSVRARRELDGLARAVAPLDEHLDEVRARVRLGAGGLGEPEDAPEPDADGGICCAGYGEGGGALEIAGTLGSASGSASLFLAALLSKVSVVIFPGVLFLYDLGYRRERPGRMLLEKLPFLAAAAVVGWIGYRLQAATDVTTPGWLGGTPSLRETLRT